jgi:hypothetical protein
MYYVVKKGDSIDQYHACFYSEAAARELAVNLKASLGHNYDIIKPSTTWTTQTLDEAMEEAQ